MLLALIAGCWHVADLWFEDLSRQSLAAAARGGVLLLLSLGLMGTGRLALALVVLFCGLPLTDLSLFETINSDVVWLELTLLAVSTILLLAPGTTAEES